MTRPYFLLIVLAAVLFACRAKAQGGEYALNGKGQPFLRKTNIDVDGEPYLFNVWMPGRAITNKGIIYDNLKLKYDVNEDFLIFVYDSADTPMKFTEAISSFIIYSPQPLTFANGFPAVDGQTPGSYYMVLAKGQVTLLKKMSKVVVEAKTYNTNTITKSFQDFNTYYIFKDGKMEKTDNPKKYLYNMDAPKKAALDTYVRANSINFKKDTDLAKIYNYYNTL